MEQTISGPHLPTRCKFTQKPRIANCVRVYAHVDVVLHALW